MAPYASVNSAGWFPQRCPQLRRLRGIGDHAKPYLRVNTGTRCPIQPRWTESAGAGGIIIAILRGDTSHCQVKAVTYARNTTATAIRTRNEIEETLERYGADGFAYATQGNLATVIFAMANRRIRFVLELPDPEEFRYTTTARPGSAATGPGRRPTTRPAASAGERCCWSSRPSWKPSPPASPPSRPSSWPTSFCPTTPPPGSGCCPRSTEPTAPAGCRPCCRRPRTPVTAPAVPFRCHPPERRIHHGKTAFRFGKMSPAGRLVGALGTMGDHTTDLPPEDLPPERILCPNSGNPW